MNQFLVLAAAEKMAALKTEDYLTRETQQREAADSSRRSCSGAPCGARGLDLSNTAPAGENPFLEG